MRRRIIAVKYELKNYGKAIQEAEEFLTHNISPSLIVFNKY